MHHHPREEAKGSNTLKSGAQSDRKIDIQLLIKQINELNDRAITLTNEQREPVSALKCLRQAQELYSQVTQP
jgi:hypothetical protein